MAKTQHKTEFGDFQTPPGLAREVCDLLQRLGHVPATIVEPTCGVGNILLAALNTFPGAGTVIGCDVNAHYLDTLGQSLASRSDTGKVRLDRCNFWLCWSQAEAELVAYLLNSNQATEFYSALVDWGAKRPITAELLRCLDLRKLATSLGREAEFDSLVDAKSGDAQRLLF